MALDLSKSAPLVIVVALLTAGGAAMGACGSSADSGSPTLDAGAGSSQSGSGHAVGAGSGASAGGQTAGAPVDDGGGVAEGAADVIASGSSGNGATDADVGEASSGAGASIPVTPSCPPATGAAVTLTTSGSGYVVSNGLVTVSFDGAGHVTQVAKNGSNLMISGDTMYVSESGGTSYYAIGASSKSVVQQSADIVELSFLDTSGGAHDMDWDLHYVVRRGVSGFYYFLVTKVGTTTHPNPATLSELRTVQRFNPALLSNGYSGERHGQLPTAAQNATFSSTTQIEDATYPLTVAPTLLPGVSSLPAVSGQHYGEGPVFSKYDWASYRTEDLVHGLYGGGYGVWLLSPSWEFYTGGPVKQELMVHHDNLILNMYHGGHFGSATANPSPGSWQKLYGPNLLYVNAGADDQVIADALARGATERGQWPYCWMNHPLFPLAGQRGTVVGNLALSHGQSVQGAMVVLAQSGPLLGQGYDYMFWAQADSTGRFVVPAVRPGNYAVHVYATGGTIVDDPANGEIVGNVTVAAGTNDVGTLTWSPPYHAHLLWAIGSSDQRSGEFRFDPGTSPGIDNTAGRTGRMYGPDATHGVWTVPPATTTYTVGTSTPQTDWYFAQSADGTWTVSFSLAAVPAGGAFLTLGIAGAARNPHLDVALNGHALASQGFGNDQTLYRSALEGGLFQMIAIPVPAGDLVAGGNKATFTLNTKGGAGAGIYYDIVKLESD